MLGVRCSVFSCALLAAGAIALAAPSDRDLGLHSDGGPWRFYPKKDRAGKLPRVLLNDKLNVTPADRRADVVMGGEQ